MCVCVCAYVYVRVCMCGGDVYMWRDVCGGEFVCVCVGVV